MIKPGYRNETFEDISQITQEELGDWGAIRYLNTWESPGSISLAVRPQSLAAVQGIPLPVQALSAGAAPSLVREVAQIRDQISQIEAARQDEPDRLEEAQAGDWPHSRAKHSRESPQQSSRPFDERIGKLIEDNYLPEVSASAREFLRRDVRVEPGAGPAAWRCPLHREIRPDGDGADPAGRHPPCTRCQGTPHTQPCGTGPDSGGQRASTAPGREQPCPAGAHARSCRAGSSLARDCHQSAVAAGRCAGLSAATASPGTSEGIDRARPASRAARCQPRQGIPQHRDVSRAIARTRSPSARRAAATLWHPNTRLHGLPGLSRAAWRRRWSDVCDYTAGDAGRAEECHASADEQFAGVGHRDRVAVGDLEMGLDDQAAGADTGGVADRPPRRALVGQVYAALQRSG